MASPVVTSRIQNRRGTQAQFDALYPPGYNGIGGVDINIWPNILLEGEVALTTDTRRVFIGNINGEYVEVTGASSSGDLLLNPLLIDLPRTTALAGDPLAATWTIIPVLTYLATPFTDLLYDLINIPGPDWNDITASTFARNGTFKITAIDGDATMTDTFAEIDTLLLYDATFKVEYNLGSVEVWYMHNFPTNLTFSTGTIKWIPF